MLIKQSSMGELNSTPCFRKFILYQTMITSPKDLVSLPVLATEAPMQEIWTVKL